MVEMEADTSAAVEIESPAPEKSADAQNTERPAPPPETRGKKRALSFFERVRQVPKADWGTRSYIYVYCLEPICNLKMGGETKYLVKLKEPIFDEDSIMVDYGSGKYRLNLVGRKAGADANDQIDVCEIEIYNPQFPPKIPEAVWMNDPRNVRWKALLPKEVPPKPETPLGTMNDALNTLSNIRRSVVEEMKPQAAAAPPTDPVQSALAVAKDLLSMRADNPMVDVMRDEMKAMRDEMKAEREENRKLQAELRQGNKPATGDPIKTVVDTIEQLKPLIKEFMPQAVETVKDVVRGRRPGFGEMVVEQGLPILGQILAPWSNALAARFMAGPPAPTGSQFQPANPAPAPQTSPGLPPASGPLPANAAQPAAPPPNSFIKLMSNPLAFQAFSSHFKDFCKPEAEGGNPESGKDFAFWVLKAEGEQPFMDARLMGVGNILQLFKQSPAWTLLQAHEQNLVKFLDQALSYNPQEAPADEEEDDDDENGVDLTKGF